MSIDCSLLTNRKEQILKAAQSLLIKPTLYKGWVAATPLTAWCLVIFVLSSVPGNRYPQIAWDGADKLVHCALYFWVGVFAWFFFKSRGAGAIKAVVFGLVYGLSDEVHQLWVPRRSFSMLDWTADAVGVFLGIGLILILNHRIVNSKKSGIKKATERTEGMETR